MNFSGQFELSLNGKEALDGSQTLCDQGVVNGDLLFLLESEPVEWLPAHGAIEQPPDRGQEDMATNQCVCPENMEASQRVCDGGMSTEEEGGRDSTIQQSPLSSVPSPAFVERGDLLEPSAEEATSSMPAVVTSAGHYEELVNGHVELSGDYTPFDLLCLALHLLMLDYGFSAAKIEVHLLVPVIEKWEWRFS